MNSTHVSSKINKVKGKIKENVGHLSGDNSMEAEGVGEQIKSKFQNVVADAKDGLKKVVDKVLDKNASSKSH